MLNKARSIELGKRLAIRADKNDLVKELTEEISKLKKENRELEDRAEMWKSRVAEIKAEKDELLVSSDDEMLTKAMAEVERQRDYIKVLEEKIRVLEQNQMTPETKLLMKLIMEKYA